MSGTAGFAPGSVIVVRDEEWIVSSCEAAGPGWRVRCVGRSEPVRSTSATFFSTLDDIAALDPADARLVRDDSPRFRRSRLWVEAVLRKTPVPLHEPGRTEALVLASAIPHNGDARSFAELVNLLDPTAVVDPTDYDVKDIAHLFIRRHRASPAVAREVGHMWAERPEPEVLAVAANVAEDAVADELSGTWLHPVGEAPPITGAGRGLFAWTLAKAVLSSPAALVETIDNRRRVVADPRSPEGRALDHLAGLAARAHAHGSAKLDALVAHLREIGVGGGVGGGDTRVVLFSERVATLGWLRREPPARPPRAARRGVRRAARRAAPDEVQMGVVERFQRADTPVRVLITGDVASEGVNLHKQCHHLVHVDIPWSLIRIEQRNGRYGQLHPPRIVALALTTSDERFSGDVRVLTRLLAKERAAHTALGDAASLLRLHDVGREDGAVRAALMAGASPDDVAPDPGPPADDDPLASFEALFATLGEDVAAAPPDPAERGLFDSEVDFLRAALYEAFDDPAAARCG